MALSKHNLYLLKSYDECTSLYYSSETLYSSFIYRLILQNPDGFKRLSFHNKLLKLSILIHRHYYYKEEKEEE